MNLDRDDLCAQVLALACTAALLSSCARGPRQPLHRERFRARDADCQEPVTMGDTPKPPARPHAFLYPAENRTDYGPDDPKADGCVLDVPDHLFCCPDVARPTDR